MKVLFITSNRIGDTVLTTGLLSYLLDRYPAATFTIACGPLGAPLFSEIPQVEKIIVVNKRVASVHWIELWKEVSKSIWELVVDLRSSVIAYCLLTRRRMVAKKKNDKVHRLDALASLAGVAELPLPALRISNRHKENAENVLPYKQQFLAIGPTANWRGKQWSGVRFAKVACRLTRSDGILPGAKIVVLGSSAEREMAKPVISNIPDSQIINLIGKVDLLTVYAILERSSMYIGNDSGLMHIAAASGTPTLGLFGPSKEANYAPRGKFTAVVRTKLSYEELTGEKAYNHKTTESLMNSLSVEMVETAAQLLWKRSSDHRPLRN